MAQILTPNELWENISFENFNFQSVSIKKEGDIIIEHIFLDGHKTEDSQVRIAGIIVRKDNQNSYDAILINRELDADYDFNLYKDLANRGYYVFAFDLAGESGHSTFYPEQVKYARLSNCLSDLSIVANGVEKTPWFEWGCVSLCALSYLQTVGVKTINLIGVGVGASALWYLVGRANITSSIFVDNCGWFVYRNFAKFGTKTLQLIDDRMAFLAGLDPSSYAMLSKTPIMILSATNSSYFAPERASDTLDKTGEDVYATLYYSPNRSRGSNNIGYNNALAFLDNFINKKKAFPYMPIISFDQENSCLKVNCENFVKVDFYFSDNISSVENRVWQKISLVNNTCTDIPKLDNENVLCFANVSYQSNITLSTNIICFKNIENNDKVVSKNLIYSNRANNEYIFDNAFDKSMFDCFNQENIVEKVGPFGIGGIYSTGGLKTKTIGLSEFKPLDGSILIFDAFVKEDVELTIRIDCDEDSYFAVVNLLGSDVWHNVNVEMNKFKTVGGKQLKTYKDANCLCFICEKEYLLNNMLWA